MSQDYEVLKAAAHWFAVLQSDCISEVDRQAWRRWLEAPANARAWGRVEQISNSIEPLMSDPVGKAVLNRRQPNRRQALKILSMVMGGGALALAGSALPWRSWAANKRTGVGEVRAWRMPDDSQIWLNTNSALDVIFDDRSRQLSLYRGEMLIQASNDRRPLLLRTAEGSLRVEEAARFTLQQRNGQTRLCVYEGTVEVRPAKGRQHTTLGAQQLDFDSRHVEPPKPVQAGRQAWAQGMLVADNLRLDEFVAELGRYRQGYLGCDPRIAGLRVVGAFPLIDTDHVLDALATTLSLRVIRRLPWWVSLEPA